jgi:hypothetical protein
MNEYKEEIDDLIRKKIKLYCHVLFFIFRYIGKMFRSIMRSTSATQLEASAERVKQSSFLFDNHIY